jgi:asparagine synthase (glutamine-hydrolysing)
LRRQLLNQDLVKQLDGHDPKRLLIEHYGTTDGDELTGMLRVDLASVLPDDYLLKVDRASMANGIEVRPPLLDHELLELAMRVPSTLKVRHGEGKWILKEAFPDLLPRHIRQRPKRGFEMPVDAWLRGPLQEMFREEVLASRSPIRDFINPIVAQRAYDAHLTGAENHRMMLWSLLVLAHWAKRYLSPVEPPRAGVLGATGLTT